MIKTSLKTGKNNKRMGRLFDHYKAKDYKSMGSKFLPDIYLLHSFILYLADSNLAQTLFRPPHPMRHSVFFVMFPLFLYMQKNAFLQIELFPCNYFIIDQV